MFTSVCEDEYPGDDFSRQAKDSQAERPEEPVELRLVRFPVFLVRLREIEPKESRRISFGNFDMVLDQNPSRNNEVPDPRKQDEQTEDGDADECPDRQPCGSIEGCAGKVPLDKIVAMGKCLTP